MILISTSINNFENINQTINQEDRLNELVTITNESSGFLDIEISDKICVFPDWKNTQPPILLPDMAYSDHILLGIVYTKLNNFEKAYSLLKSNSDVLNFVDILNRIQNGIEIPSNSIVEKQDYFQFHNNAVALHYGNISNSSLEKIIVNYQNALILAKDNENKAFTVKHFALLLIDNNYLNEAIEIIERQLKENLSPIAVIELKTTLCGIWIKQIETHHSEDFLLKIKDTLWECLQYYEAENRTINAAFLLSDAALIATISKSYSEALGYASKACTIFDNENLPELLAEAQLSKANVLHAWSQDGNPQFFRAAMMSCQEALKVYTREFAPDKFADIHHQLGIIYSEIPDEIRKKGIWASVSVSSFNEALTYYNKLVFPYEYAVICHSQATAFTKYPTAKHTDNHEKALEAFRKLVLNRRNPDLDEYEVLDNLRRNGLINAANYLHSLL